MLEGIEIDVWRPLAGLMIFLLAMGLIENAIKALAGNKVKQVIARNTDRPISGVLTGTIATALLQSSSLVGLLVLAFVGARIMVLKQALLIVFGANLGTTATGWIVALLGFKLNLDSISLPLIASFGFLYAIAKVHPAREIGQLGLGIGLLLLALQFMKSGIADVESAVGPAVLADFALWQYALFGIAASALMQSSSAVMVLTLSAINSGIIDLPAGAALMVGADLGTTSTVIFGAIGGTASKKRVALGHVLFNLVTDVIAFAFLIPLVTLVSVFSDPLLSLVAFHSLFNIIGVFIWTPMVSRFANRLEQMFLTETTQVSQFLEPSTLATEESALTAIRNELEHLRERVVRQNESIFVTDLAKLPTKEDYRKSYRTTKALEAEILEFALALSSTELSPQFGPQVENLLQAARSLLLSSKLCKDNLNDLRDLADYQPNLLHKLVCIQFDYYKLLSDYIRSQEAISIDSLVGQNEAGHDRLHEYIYLLIKGGQLPRNKVSTILNLNRAFFNSNTALLNGLYFMAQGEPMNAKLRVA